MSASTAARDEDAPAPATGVDLAVPIHGSAPRLRILRIVLVVSNQGTQAMVLGGLALFMPRIRPDLGITFAQGGTLAAASTITYAAMQVPAGYLADRFRPKRVFDVGLLGIIVLGYVLCIADDYWMFLVTLAALGVFRSLIFPAGMMLIAHQFPDDRRAFASGLYVAGGFSSNVFLSLLGPLLVGPLGWRAAFGTFVTIAGVLVALQVRVGDPGPARARRAGGRLDGAGRLFRSPVLWICCWIQFVRFAVANGVTYWTPTFLVDERGLDLTVAGWITGVGAVITSVSNVGGGLLSDVLRRPVQVVLVSVVVLSVCLALLSTADRTAIVVALVLVQCAFIQVYFGSLFEIPLLFLGREHAGLATGVANTFANIGGFTATITLGAVMDATGSFGGGFLLLSAACVTAAGAAVALAAQDHARRTLRRSTT